MPRVFTGIVEELGTIAAVEGDERRPAAADRGAARSRRSAAIGDSINVSGCCLTVVAIRDGDAARSRPCPRRSRRTALGALGPGARVNLEDALRAGEPYGGHIVQGHVDGVGELRRAPRGGHRPVAALPRTRARPALPDREGQRHRRRRQPDVAELHDDGFAVAIVPHTMQVTTFGTLAVGDPVNLEADMIARYVERLLAASAATPLIASPQCRPHGLRPLSDRGTA